MLMVLVPAMALSMLVGADHVAQAGKEPIGTCKDAEAGGRDSSSLLKPLDTNTQKPSATEVRLGMSAGQSGFGKAIEKTESPESCRETGCPDATGIKISAVEVDAVAEATACLGAAISDRSGDGRKVLIWFGDSNTLPDALPEGRNSSWCYGWSLGYRRLTIRYSGIELGRD